MEKLDQLINKFKEAKEELEKNSSPLHDTVEGFMGGLKALPKGSAERGKFITAHVNHGPFLHALNQHPQGKQIHTMLMGHLNSKANAGPQAFGGGKVAVSAPVGPGGPIIKSEEDPLEELEKFYISPYTMFASRKKDAPAKPASNKPTGIDKIKAVSKEKIEPTTIVSEDQKRAKAMGAPTNPTKPKLTGLDRIKAESMKPISPTVVKGEEKVKKSLEEIKKSIGPMAAKMKGAGNTMLTNPNDTGRANMYQDALKGAYQYKRAVPAPVAPAPKLTGLDRIKAESQKPIAKDEDSTAVRPPAMNAAGHATASAWQAPQWAPKQGESVKLPGGDPNQVINHPYPFHSMPQASGQANTNYPVTSAAPKIKPQGQGLHHISASPNEFGPAPTKPLATAPGGTVSMRGAAATGSTAAMPGPKRVEMPVIKGENVGPKFEKTINESYAAPTNMVKKEKLKVDKGGQWSVKAEMKKAECSKCHADPCECQTSGVNIDKMDGGDMSPGSGC